MWKFEYWCITTSFSRHALANSAQTFGVVTAGGRPVRSKKSTSNGSVRGGGYISQSCRSRPRPKRSITSLICWRSQSSRTISSVVTGQCLSLWLYEHVAGRVQEQGADLVIELAFRAEPPDDVGHRDAAHAGQRDDALVLGGDAAADASGVHRLAVRCDLAF